MTNPEHRIDLHPSLARASVGSSLRGRRVLYAEDGACDRRLVMFLLTKAGITVVTAGDGRVALERFAEAAATRPFDAVLLDIGMPVLDGYETAHALRRRDEHLPIIALTANDDREDRARCLTAGCSDYLAKPFDGEELLEMLVKNLELAESRSSVPLEVAES